MPLYDSSLNERNDEMEVLCRLVHNFKRWTGLIELKSPLLRLSREPVMSETDYVFIQLLNYFGNRYSEKIHSLNHLNQLELGRKLRLLLFVRKILFMYECVSERYYLLSDRKNTQ